MELTQIRDLLTQIQTGARVTSAIGEPVQIGDRVVLPVVEVRYGGGGGGGFGKASEHEKAEGSGGGGGGGVHIRPLGCWVISSKDERWIPALDINRVILAAGGILTLALLTIRAIARRR